MLSIKVKVFTVVSTIKKIVYLLCKILANIKSYKSRNVSHFTLSKYWRPST